MNGKELLSGVVSDGASQFEAYARIVCRICLVVGPAFVGLALVFVFNSYRFLKHCDKATGTVVQLVPLASSDESSVTYAALFRFVASDGKSYQVRSLSSSNPPSFQMGQRVNVLYETGSPATAKLDSFFELWGLALCFGILGAVATATGLALRRIGRWLERRGLSVVPEGAAAAQG